VNSLLATRIAHREGKLPFCGSRFRSLRHFAEDIVFAKNQVLLVLDFDLGAAVLSEKHAITDLNIQGDALAFVQFACADGNDLPS
jgi:hypothetical protein